MPDAINVAQLQRMQTPITGNDRMEDLPVPQQADPHADTSFTETLRSAIDQVDEAQKASEGQMEAYIAGEQDDLHEVTIAMNQAQIHFQTMAEVRNRTMEAYQELMQMQV